METKRVCITCNQEKPITEFKAYGNGSRKKQCNLCDMHCSFTPLEQTYFLILHIRSVIRLIESGKWKHIQANPLSGVIATTDEILSDYQLRLLMAQSEYSRLSMLVDS